MIGPRRGETVREVTNEDYWIHSVCTQTASIQNIRDEGDSLYVYIRKLNGAG